MTQELSLKNDNAIKQFIQDTIMPGASDSELVAFMHVAKATGLDPVKRQIFAVERWNAKLNRMQWSTQCSVDGFRAVAEATQDYEGQVGPFWCGVDGIWRDVWLQPQPPAASKVGVWRKGFREPLYRIALFSEYAQKSKDGKLTKFWSSMPALMLAKCAESLALRGAFPQKLSGLYTSDEFPVEVEVKSEVAPVLAQNNPTIPAHAALTTPTVKVMPKPQTQPQGQPAASETLQDKIDRAKSGGPIVKLNYAIEAGWDGPLPTCMESQVPFGSKKGTPLVDVSHQEARDMCDWIVSKAKRPLSGVYKKFCAEVQDYLNQDPGSQVEHDVPLFNTEGPTRI